MRAAALWAALLALAGFQRAVALERVIAYTTNWGAYLFVLSRRGSPAPPAAAATATDDRSCYRLRLPRAHLGELHVGAHDLLAALRCT